MVYQFLSILGVAITEEKIFMYFTVCTKVLPCRSYKFACKVFKCNDRSLSFSLIFIEGITDDLTMTRLFESLGK